MAKPAQKTIRIENRRARFEYELLDTFTAGMVLMGSEIKSIREGAAGLVDAYCLVLKANCGSNTCTSPRGAWEPTPTIWKRGTANCS